MLHRESFFFGITRDSGSQRECLCEPDYWYWYYYHECCHYLRSLSVPRQKFDDCLARTDLSLFCYALFFISNVRNKVWVRMPKKVQAEGWNHTFPQLVFPCELWSGLSLDFKFEMKSQVPTCCKWHTKPWIKPWVASPSTSHADKFKLTQLNSVSILAQKQQFPLQSSKSCSVHTAHWHSSLGEINCSGQCGVLASQFLKFWTKTQFFNKATSKQKWEKCAAKPKSRSRKCCTARKSKFALLENLHVVISEQLQGRKAECFVALFWYLFMLLATVNRKRWQKSLAQLTKHLQKCKQCLFGWLSWALWFCCCCSLAERQNAACMNQKSVKSEKLKRHMILLDFHKRISKKCKFLFCWCHCCFFHCGCFKSTKILPKIKSIFQLFSHSWWLFLDSIFVQLQLMAQTTMWCFPSSRKCPPFLPLFQPQWKPQQTQRLTTTMWRELGMEHSIELMQTVPLNAKCGVAETIAAASTLPTVMFVKFFPILIASALHFLNQHGSLKWPKLVQNSKCQLNNLPKRLTQQESWECQCCLANSDSVEGKLSKHKEAWQVPQFSCFVHHWSVQKPVLKLVQLLEVQLPAKWTAKKHVFWTTETNDCWQLCRNSQHGKRENFSPSTFPATMRVW